MNQHPKCCKLSTSSLFLVSIILLVFIYPLDANVSSLNITTTTAAVAARDQKKDCANMSQEEVDQNAYRLFIGILIAICGGFLSSFGLVFQKYAHKLNEPLPKEQRSSFKVVTGFATYIAGTAVFLAASPFAPQSILSALASVNLLGNAIWAPLLLKEKVSKLDFIGLVFISGGIVLVVVFGNQCSLTYTADEIVRFFLAFGQLVYFIAVMSIVIGFILAIRLTENTFWEHFDYAMKLKKKRDLKNKARKIDQLRKELAVHQRGNNETNNSAMDTVECNNINHESGNDTEEIKRRRTSVVEKLTMKQRRRSSFEYNTLYDMRIARGKRLAISFALVAAVLAGYATVLVKIVLTLVEVSVSGDNQFIHFSTYVFIVFLIVFEVIHIKYLNNGLKHFDAMFFVPMFMVSLTVITSISGGIFFQEFVNFDLMQFLFYPVGLLCTVIGVFILSQRDAAKKAEQLEVPMNSHANNGRARSKSWPPPKESFDDTENDSDADVGAQIVLEMTQIKNPVIDDNNVDKSDGNAVGDEKEIEVESRIRASDQNC
jgi:uncharacterized membrane protein